MALELPELNPCPFCEYVARGVTTKGVRVATVSERALTLSFLDPLPMQAGHILVVPKRHAPTLLDLAREEAHEMIDHARDLARALVDSLAPAGINVFQNNGVAAGQSVPHYHLHLVPRHAVNGNVFAELDRFAMADRIRTALEARSR